MKLPILILLILSISEVSFANDFLNLGPMPDETGQASCASLNKPKPQVTPPQGIPAPPPMRKPPTGKTDFAKRWLEQCAMLSSGADEFCKGIKIGDICYWPLSPVRLSYEAAEEYCDSMGLKVPGIKELEFAAQNYPKSICSHYQAGGTDPSTTCGGGIYDYTESSAVFWRGCPTYDDNFIRRSFTLNNGLLVMK